MRTIYRKKGVTVTVVAIAVAIMAIIISSASVVGSSSIASANYDGFLSKLSRVEDEVNIYITENKTIPIKLNSVVGKDNLHPNLLDQLVKNKDEFNNLYELDTSKLELTGINIGKGTIANKDIFLIAENTNNIYYLNGLKYKNKRYYNIEDIIIPPLFEDLVVLRGVNKPQILQGMTPIKFDTNGNVQQTTKTDEEWYNYIEQTEKTPNKGTSKWANIQTQDGSQWVWVPRYAYKISYKTPTNKSDGGTIDVKFLKGTSSTITADGSILQSDYIVHPAFKNDVAAGGWDAELTGIWVSKYEAGFEFNTDKKVRTGKEKATGLKYSKISAQSNIYGTITSGTTDIYYPVFKPNSYSYNNINIGDCYALSKKLSDNIDNPYGLPVNANSHMMKNSEWGAVAYLAHSNYGRNGTEVTINSTNLNDNPATIYAQTAGGDYKTNITQSTTGNVYGIYDMSGGSEENISGYINNNTSDFENYGNLMVSEEREKSTKYKTVYAYNTSNDTDKNNYLQSTNSTRKGEAIWETSAYGSDYTSWFVDYSYFACAKGSFIRRGGYYGTGSQAGLFNFTNTHGTAWPQFGFRSILCFS